MKINYLKDHDKWLEFLNYKLDKEFVNDKEKEILKEFITNKKYLNIANKIVNNNYTFSNPKKHIISKNSSNKKRIVYNYTNDEMIILKYLSYLLYDYDYLFSNNLYSFKKNSGVKNAIKNISNIKNINKMYGYKVDIKNYFNSIDINILLSQLNKDIDKSIYKLLSELLLNEYVEYNNELIIEKKGVMAGTPISAFLANYYLKEIDEYFWNKKVVYFRYADDIILFTNNLEESIKYKDILIEYLNKYNLTINKNKEYIINPHDKWEFLGFSFDNKTIDISINSINKIKGKIKRSSRGIRRWMIKKDAKSEWALKAINRKFNRKFYGKDNNDELSWKYWFFPTINTSKNLKIIDNYMQSRLRYLITGKYNKKNYKIVPYKLLKQCNYKSLVNEYYKQFIS